MTAHSDSPSDSSAGQLFRSMLRMVRTPGFALLTASYGISVGVYYAISTVLNYLIRNGFKDSEDAGNIGLILVLAGLLGSVLCGLLLDATRKYKEVTLGVYILSLVGLSAFAASFFSSAIWTVYLTSFFLGFFLTGYIPLGFELAVELTYPEPEGTSAGILNLSAQVFGIVFTQLCGLPLERSDGGPGGLPNAHLWVNTSMSCALLLGVVLTALVPGNLRRQEAQRAAFAINAKRWSMSMPGKA